MLILKRRDGEKVQIGGDVSILVYDCKQGSVRIAFDAPEHVRIMRAELSAADRKLIGKPKTERGTNG